MICGDCVLGYDFWEGLNVLFVINGTGNLHFEEICDTRMNELLCF